MECGLNGTLLSQALGARKPRARLTRGEVCIDGHKVRLFRSMRGDRPYGLRNGLFWLPGPSPTKN